MAQEVRTVEPNSPQTTGQNSTQSAPRSDAPGQSNRPTFVPAADIYENGDSLVVLCEMPGVASDGVDITLERRVLTIRARSGEHEHSGYQRVYTEYSEGDYERVFTLSEDIDRDGIEATARDGVLHLVLPKAAPAKTRKIELKPA